MEDDLANLWGKLSLEEDENSRVDLHKQAFDELAQRGQSCLIGKLLSERVVSKETIRRKLIRGWRPIDSLTFKILGDNLFLIKFANYYNKICVLEGRPWIFEGVLFSVGDFDGSIAPTEVDFSKASFWIRMHKLPLACIGKEMGMHLGASVGKVEEVDTNEDGEGWGEYLRVRIKINILIPLTRGRVLRMKDRELWIPFQYEKLPKYCFQCGLISHGKEGCLHKEPRRKQGEDSFYQYGPWLRASSPKRWIEKEESIRDGDNATKEHWRWREYENQGRNSLWGTGDGGEREVGKERSDTGETYSVKENACMESSRIRISSPFPKGFD